MNHTYLKNVFCTPDTGKDWQSVLYSEIEWLTIETTFTTTEEMLKNQVLFICNKHHCPTTCVSNYWTTFLHTKL